MHTPGKAIITGGSGDGKRIFMIAEGNDGWNDLRCEIDSDDCDSEVANANAARLALGWNLLESGIVELLLSSCDEFMQVNAKYEYEFESNEPRVYRQMHEAIVKARSILSQLPKE